MEDLTQSSTFPFPKARSALTLLPLEYPCLLLLLSHPLVSLRIFFKKEATYFSTEPHSPVSWKHNSPGKLVVHSSHALFTRVSGSEEPSWSHQKWTTAAQTDKVSTNVQIKLVLQQPPHGPNSYFERKYV